MASSPVTTPHGSPTERTPLLAKQQPLPVTNPIPPQGSTDNDPFIADAIHTSFDENQYRIIQNHEEHPERVITVMPQDNHTEIQNSNHRLVFGIFTGISLFFYFSMMISVGALYINQSSKEPSLPIWLIVEGILGLLLLVQAVDFFNNDKSKCRTTLFIFHLMYHIVMVILATFSIYGTSNNAINATLYKYMFGFITTFYVILVLYFIMIICLYLCTVYPRNDTALPNWALFIYIILFALFLVLFIIGLYNNATCTHDHNSALWLFVEGISGIIILLQCLELSINQRNKCNIFFLFIHALFNLSWFLYGAISVYGLNAEYDDVAYLLAFWFVTIVIGLIALAIITGSLVLYIMHVPIHLSPEITPWKLAGCTMLMTIISISMIVIGSLYDENCPDIYHVNIFLILEGSFGVLLALLYLDYKTHHYSVIRDLLVKFNVAICISLLICGSVWVGAKHKHRCYSLPYIFSCYIIIILYVFLGLLILYKILVKCGCLCCGRPISDNLSSVE